MIPTKEHILSTAFKLFFEHGFKGVTMRELVKASGMSKGAFYHYFSSKEELYDLSLELFLTKFLETYRLELDESLSLRENLKAIYDRFTPIVEQVNSSSGSAAEGLSNYLIFIQSLMKKPEFRAKMKAYNEGFYRDLSKHLARAQLKKEIKSSLDPDVLALHIAGLMKGISVLFAFANMSESPTIAFKRIIDQLFDQIETTPQI
jgi:AcrR family transcriptional regulator